MRIVIAAAAFLAAALAGCGQRTQNIQNEAGGLPTPGPRPGGNASGDLNSDQAFRQSYRTVQISICVNGARTQSTQGRGPPAGTDFRPYCTCFIDRAMAGLTIEQLTSNNQFGPREQGIAEQCARESGLRPNAAAPEDSGDTPDAGPPDTGGK